MPLNLTCPSCQSRLQIPDQFAGRKVKCPTCAGVFEAQSEAAPMRRREEPAIPLRRDDDFEDAPRSRRSYDERDDVPLPRRSRDDYEDRPRRPRDDDDRPRRARDDYEERPSRPRDDDDEFDEPRPRRRRRKRTNVGMIVGMIVGGAVLLVAVIVLIVVIVKNSDGLPGSTWAGSETLPGFGRLEFQFKSKGQCIMIDARNTVQGTFTHSGKNVTIRFANATYEGTINGDTMSGTAREMPGNFQWTWNVKRR